MSELRLPIPDVLDRRLGPALALVAGGLVVATWDAFRWPVGTEPLALGIALIALVVTLASTRRRPAAVALGLFAGSLLALKPWLVPIVDESGWVGTPTSEEAMTYSAPGKLLVLFALAVAVRKRHVLAAELRPEAVTALAFVASLLAAIAWSSQPDLRDAAAPVRSTLARHREVMARIAQAVDAGQEAPSEALALAPRPRLVLFRDDAPTPGDTILLPFVALSLPDVDPGPGDTLHEAAGRPFLRALRLAAPSPGPPRRAWFGRPAASELAWLRRAVAMRYVAFVRHEAPETAPEAGGPSLRPVSVWLADLAHGQLLVRRHLAPTSSTYALRDAAVEALREATGGEFGR